MFDQCRKAGLKPPEFRLENGFFILTIWRKQPAKRTEARGRHQVGTKLALSEHQVKILRKCMEESVIGKLMTLAERSDRTKFRNQVLNPLIKEGLIEMTIPDKPKSSNQKYRLTDKGRNYLKSQGKKK